LQDISKRYGARRSVLAAAVAGCLALSACATPDSDTYTSSDVGQTIETSQGRVLSSRPVEIKVVGAGIGYLAEKEIRSGEGIEYIVELEDGRVVTLVQNRADEEQPIPDGEPVLVQFGSQYTRIRPLDTDSAAGASAGGSGAGSGWVNPDATAGDEGAGSGSQDVSDPAITSEPIDLNSGQGQQE